MAWLLIVIITIAYVLVTPSQYWPFSKHLLKFWAISISMIVFVIAINLLFAHVLNDDSYENISMNFWDVFQISLAVAVLLGVPTYFFKG